MYPIEKMTKIPKVSRSSYYKECQYTSEDFKILMGQQNLVLSMSGKRALL